MGAKKRRRTFSSWRQKTWRRSTPCFGSMASATFISGPPEEFCTDSDGSPCHGVYAPAEVECCKTGPCCPRLSVKGRRGGSARTWQNQRHLVDRRSTFMACRLEESLS